MQFKKKINYNNACKITCKITFKKRIFIKTRKFQWVELRSVSIFPVERGFFWVLRQVFVVKRLDYKYFLSN